MDNGSEKLARDVDILSAMAADMDQYLDSDVLFWPLGAGNMPALTLGGYLMREQRLLALKDQLAPEQQAEVDQAVARFNQVLDGRVVRFEEKAHHELAARLRQWGEYLKDVGGGTADRTSNYNTAVETRAMIDALINRLDMPPYELAARPVASLEALDARLGNYWRTGDFVWPEGWEAAYPKDDYWWLYGSPGGM